MYNSTYPSYEDLLRQSEEINVDEFSQFELFGNLDGFNNGICAGLSATHIAEQLRYHSFDPITNNSSQKEKIFKSSTLIQNKCHDELCLTETLHKQLSIENQNAEFKPYRPFFCESYLKNKIQKTISDSKSRGVLIGFFAKRFPYDGASANGGHLLSMTIENNDGDLYCTAMDSNTFFAKGKGKKGCEDLAKKMEDTVKAYGAGTTYNYSVSCSPTKNE